MKNICPYCNIKRPVMIYRRNEWRCRDCKAPLKRDYRNEQYFVAFTDFMGKYFISRFTPEEHTPKDEYLRRDGLHRVCGDSGLFLNKNIAHELLEEYYEKNNFIKKREFEI